MNQIKVTDTKGELFLVNPDNISTINILSDKTIINFNTTINIMNHQTKMVDKEIPAFIYTRDVEWKSFETIRELLGDKVKDFFFPIEDYIHYHSIINMKNVIYTIPIKEKNRLCFYFNHNVYNTRNNSLETYVVFSTYDDYSDYVADLERLTQK